MKIKELRRPARLANYRLAIASWTPRRSRRVLVITNNYKFSHYATYQNNSHVHGAVSFSFDDDKFRRRDNNYTSL